jgi:5-methyltetrahydrofolate--homocysteine methyltransferase
MKRKVTQLRIIDHVQTVESIVVVLIEGMGLVVTVRELFKNEIILFDGAMGTMLQQAGLISGEIPETYNILQPEIIKGIHQSYLEAGADVITANTFQANELKLKGCGYTVEEIIQTGVKNAKEAGAKYVALDIGPLGQLMEPMGTITFEEAYQIFARQVKAGVEAGADIILLETLSDLYEAKAAILAAKENSDLPIFTTMNFQEDGRTFIGTDPITATIVLQSLGVDALGVNCSLGPKELMPIVQEIISYAKVPVMVQPNAGLPRIDGENTV